MVRAMMGDWVAWNPEMIPQAMVMKSMGSMGALNIPPLKEALSWRMAGVWNPSIISLTKMASVPMSNNPPKMG